MRLAVIQKRVFLAADLSQSVALLWFYLLFYTALMPFSVKIPSLDRSFR
jgi:hypothetical protein